MPEFIQRFDGQRLKRLARRLIYFESPHLFEESERLVIAAARRRGEGSHDSPPWMTITQALSVLDSIEGELSDALQEGIPRFAIGLTAGIRWTKYRRKYSIMTLRVLRNFSVNIEGFDPGFRRQ